MTKEQEAIKYIEKRIKICNENADICNETLYWNTTGAYNSKISLKCEVIDIGKIWIWVHVKGCLAYNNLLAENLSKEPLYIVTNSKN